MPLSTVLKNECHLLSQLQKLSGPAYEMSVEKNIPLDLSIYKTTINNTTIAYVQEGQGPVVLLLHGAPMTSLAFVRVIRELRKNYRVIAPDLPGFGQSQCPPNFSGTLQDYTQFIVDFCISLDLQQTIMYVNDTSGCIGLAAAAQIRPRIAGLVIADTVQIPLTGRAWFVRQFLKYVIASGLFRFLNRRLNLLPWLVAKVAPFINRFPSVESDELVRQFDTYDKRDRVVNMLGNLGRDVTFMRETAHAIKTYLRQVPTLILFGQFDPVRFVGSPKQYRKIFINHTNKIITFEEHFPILASGTRVAKAVHLWFQEIIKPNLKA